MTAQFWWGLAMLPLGTLALAAAVAAPIYALGIISAHRRAAFATWKEQEPSGVHGTYRHAALLAVASWARNFVLPSGYRVIIMREPKGLDYRKPGMAAREIAIRGALRSVYEKERR